MSRAHPVMWLRLPEDILFHRPESVKKAGRPMSVTNLALVSRSLCETLSKYGILSPVPCSFGSQSAPGVARRSSYAAFDRPDIRAPLAGQALAKHATRVFLGVFLSEFERIMYEYRWQYSDDAQTA